MDAMLPLLLAVDKEQVSTRERGRLRRKILSGSVRWRRSLAMVASLATAGSVWAAQPTTSTKGAKAPPSQLSAVLPDVLTGAPVTRNTASWTIQDIIGVRRIQDTAIQGSSRVGAFVLEQSSIADGKNHYGLYDFYAAHIDPPRKIAEAEYMADLTWRPHTEDWTLLADFGVGVQLYIVKRSGAHLPLLLNVDTEVVGGSDGMLAESTEGPRLTGVVSYGWSPDGRRFWYSRLRHRDEASQNTLLDAGIVFDDHKPGGLSASTMERATTIANYELRVFDTADGSDHLIATSPAGSRDAVFADDGVAWADSSHLQYRQFNIETGALVWSLWRFDLDSRKAIKLTTAGPHDAYYSTPTKDGYLAVHGEGSTNALVEVGLDGRLIRRYGAVGAGRLNGGVFWRSPLGETFIYGVHLPDRDGLDVFPQGALSNALEAIPDHLSACSFNTDLSFGLCSDESLIKAPELVSISGTTGKLATIARPNARYDAIKPLRTVSKEWTNRYGFKNTGYVTYPRDYVPGRSYPALVVSHGWDARNSFALDWFQWEFPIQVMAEQGYFILSLNQPRPDPSVPAPNFPGGVDAGVEKQQFNKHLNPTASFDEAIESLIASGDVNPKAVGIAGYSGGAETTYFVISHSQLFSAASFGDDPGEIPSWFWIGVGATRTGMKALYGGSPFDSAALDNYRKYATSFRLDKVKTPLLQQFASTQGASFGLESDELFKDAGIPSELVIYPMESHIFYAPRHRASAMARNLDWFNYWLLGKRDPDPAKAEQYARWDAMAAIWRKKQAAAAAATDTAPQAKYRESAEPRR
jgi:dipeptidyl aminopeptidase/acylaminoacyl peptidase